MPVYTPLRTGNPYIDRPLSPNAFDDEFEGGSPDLATRGYTVLNAGTGATLTRAGDIAPWDGTGPVGNTYWSTLSGSWIYIQGANGVQIDVMKTISLSAGDSYFARMGGTHNVFPGGSGRYNEIGLYGWTGTALDSNNRVYRSNYDTTTAASYLSYDLFRITAGVGGGFTRVPLGTTDICGIHFDSGTTHHVVLISSADGHNVTAVITGTPAAATLVRFGVRNAFSTSGGAVPQIWAIDYIRKKTSHAWMVP